MPPYYDHKTRGLIVEVDEAVLDGMLREVSEKFGVEDFTARRVTHISYHKRLESDSKRSSKGALFFLIYTGISLLTIPILMLGLYKLYEIVRDMLLF